MFASVEEVQERFRASRYIASRRISTVFYLASRMDRPVLVEGPAGVGKTELAKVLAETTGRPLIRLQCYEGLDEAKALYEWKYAKQLLYTQLLRERIGELIADAPSLPEAVDRIAGQEDAFFSRRFLSPRPLLGAILADEPVVLLVDEIDKAEPEFEAFLLEVLSDFQVSVPELGTIKARHIPLVVLTSNNARELSDGLKRRCLHLFIDFPRAGEELAIIRLKVPEASEQLARQVVSAVQKIRALELRKAPSVSESLDWARSLVILNADRLDPRLVESTLTLLVKHEKDLERVKGASTRSWPTRSPRSGSLSWTSGSSSSSATCSGRSCASRPPRRSTRSRPPRRSGSMTARLQATRSPRPSSRSRATSPTFDRIFDLYFLDLQALGAEAAEGPRPRGPVGAGAARPAARAGRHLDLDELTELLLRGRGQRHGDGHPRRAGRATGSSGSCTSSRSATSRAASPTSSTGRRSSATSRPHHAAAGGAGAWTRACSRASATTSSCGSRPSAG